MTTELIVILIVLYFMFGSLAALFSYTFHDDMTGPENIVIGLVWPLTIVVTIAIGAIRLVRRYDLL